MGIVHESDLQTVETLIDFVFSEEIIRILVNLKKLNVEYENGNLDNFNLNNLSKLRKLEDLEIAVRWLSFPIMTWKHAFPMSLKKLHLLGVPFPWENMTIIGSLSNLQVLVMTGKNFTEVSEWKTTEGEFVQLKYFYSTFDGLVKWEMEKEHFPCLETLILGSVKLIDEIPNGIGEIDTLQYIELNECKKSLVDSAQRTQKHQHENGKEVFGVHAIDGFKHGLF